MQTVKTKQKFKEAKYKDPNWEPPATGYEHRVKQALEKEGFSVSHNEKLFGYYPDLRISNTKILIEIDGGYHTENLQREADSGRTKVFEKYGFTVLRFTNEQTKDIAKIVEIVRYALGIRPKKALEIVVVNAPNASQVITDKLVKQNNVRDLAEKKRNEARRKIQEIRLAEKEQKKRDRVNRAKQSKNKNKY